MRSRVTLSILVVMAVCSASAQAPSRDQILEAQLKIQRKPTPAMIAAGRKMYDVLCVMCHRFGPIGEDVGPDLTTVNSRFGKKEILEAILWPSKVISDQYESELFGTADGKVHHGMVVRETATALQIRTIDSARPIVLQTSEITSRTKSPKSFMPEALIDSLSPTDIANLMAFIQAGPPKSDSAAPTLR